MAAKFTIRYARRPTTALAERTFAGNLIPIDRHFDAAAANILAAFPCSAERQRPQ